MEKEVQHISSVETLSLAKPSELYPEIELDEQEIELALAEGRRQKFVRIQRAAYQEKVNTPEQYPSYTAEELSIMLKKTPVGKDREGNDLFFQIDDDNREALKLLCYYFTNDARFEQEGRSLQKGVLLFGGVGVGKSLVMELLQQNQKQSYRLISCIDVVSEFTNQSSDDRKQGTNPLGIFCGDLPSSVGANPFGHRRLGFCFDDLGMEDFKAMYYGQTKNCMEEILWTRHKSGDFTKTHLTTNLSADELKTTYGIRIYDRLREMMNVITWPTNAKSRRV